MFGMALSRPSLTMQLTSGMDIFSHACGQKANTSSNFCDNIQHGKRCFCFVICDTIFRLFFLEITTISYFQISQRDRRVATY